MRKNTHRFGHRSTLIVAFSFAGLSLVPLFAQATLDTGEDRLVPYQGYLESNGAPVSAAMDIRFGLSSSTPSNFDCLLTADFTDPLPSCGIWWEEQSGVSVSAGRFSVQLGQAAALTDTVFAQPDLYLAIAIRNPAETTAFTLLPGRQRLLAVPFANRAVAAKNYTVSGDLTVGGDANVGGDTYLGTGANPLKFSSAWSGFPDLPNTNQSEISNDTGTYKRLMIIGNRSEDSNVRKVGIWDHLDVNGTLNVTGDVSGLTVTWGTCSNVADNKFEDAGGNQPGPLRYLDRMNNVSCPANTVLVDWGVNTTSSGYKMVFRCCNLVVR